ncbi:hypothetical protein CHLNCDRAFT_138340 [Chlorella variabilis]|uniref:PH domain-containing protein n=1 Tax=Chlorella variabilis TaxID=554065 RepID=E1ZMU1_CHLVA|nr:hypothetical protein CHLNCDRAFT_138340 [Chlorella variabilis]EFN52750.1 hypothetical protein CHLNCDRAFT_138340 [Chlorella variabilis]|eukprot:XP_005844852.1 hypothetical protein CHLNCDRAFT_138340 [Chlorella variabilis]
MQPSGPSQTSGGSGPPPGLTPRLSSGISFKAVGDWFQTLGDDLGSVIGIPRGKSVRRSPTPSGPSQHDAAMVPRLPSTSLLSKQQQIVVGMLMKYVNLGAGYRHRLFVLQDGVLRYYKVYGPTAVNVHQLLDVLRQQGELYPIGAEVSLLESRDERMSEGGSGTAAAAYVPPSPRSARARARLPPPAAEIHLQVASLRESNADYRKFYVHSGTSTLTLRAESKEDRWVWMQALQTCKGSWEGMTPAEASALKRDAGASIVSQDERFMARLQEVKRTLAAKGVSREVSQYMEDLLEHQQYHEVLVAEENKRKALLDIVYGLENEKRQLETALVVEGTQAAAMKHRLTSGAASDSEEQLTEYERQESGVVGSPGNGEEEEEQESMSSDAEDSTCCTYAAAGRRFLPLFLRDAWLDAWLLGGRAG